MGLVPAALAVLAVALPLVTFKPNRIAAGRGLAFWASLPPVPAAAGGLALLLLGLAACLRMAPALRLGLAFLALALLAGLIGLAPGSVVPPKDGLCPRELRGRLLDDAAGLRHHGG